jgi:glycine betaine catabolism A
MTSPSRVKHPIFQRTNPWKSVPTLPGKAYWSEEIFQEECEKIFYAEWICVGRTEELSNPSDYMTINIADQSIIITRDKDNSLHAFYNVCRHRGTKLCDEGKGHAKNGKFTCPYHAWTYSMDGQLIGAPMVNTEGFDKANIKLASIALDTWEGFIFINMTKEPSETLADKIINDPNQVTQWSRYRLSELRIGRRVVTEYKANWKIGCENYNECLHCASVHPELVRLVPIYRHGMTEESDDSWGVHLDEKFNSLTLSGTSNHPHLPGLNEEDKKCYYGFLMFPMFNVDMYSNMVIASYRFPLSAEKYIRVEHYLFDADSLADSDFDPSDLIDFDRLISIQDQEIIERAQTGMRSRGFQNGGVLTYNDWGIVEWNEQYRHKMQS